MTISKPRHCQLPILNSLISRPLHCARPLSLDCTKQRKKIASLIHNSVHLSHVSTLLTQVLLLLRLRCVFRHAPSQQLGFNVCPSQTLVSTLRAAQLKAQYPPHSTAVPPPSSNDANETNYRLHATCVDQGPDCLMSLALLSIAIHSVLRTLSQQSRRLMGDG